MFSWLKKSSSAPAATPNPSWGAKLKAGLSKTGSSISTLFLGAKVDDALLEELEEALLMADAGVEATEKILAQLKQRVKQEKIVQADGVRAALQDILQAHLQALEKPLVLDAAQPLVLMIAGVNGAGKTTSIGKLAKHMQQQGCSVLLAAGDTLRASNCKCGANAMASPSLPKKAATRRRWCSMPLVPLKRVAATW